MNRAVTIAIAVVLLVIVMAVFISPAVDLPPTALRAALWVLALFATLAIPRIVFSGLFHAPIGGCTPTQKQGAVQSPPLVDLYCVRLC